MGFLLAGFLITLGAIAAVHAAPFVFGALAVIAHAAGLAVICLFVAGIAWLAKK